ncbi:MAG TPA: hypothetical protein VIY10_00020, partial [Solirubrobacteraceae bacterium]
MSGSEEQRPSSGRRWRAPVVGAATGLVVAAAIVVPSAIAAGAHSAGRSAGRSAGQCVASKSARAIASANATGGKVGAPAGRVPDQFAAAIAQLRDNGTITAAQALTLDAAIESGSINPQQLVADGVVSAAQMKRVNDRLVAIKMGLAAQAQTRTQTQASSSASAP